MNKLSFLKDVLICSLGAYGGPEAHIGVFLNQLVSKKKYLSEEELIELNALCSILPGPTSTQTIVAVGYKMGGKSLAFLSMVVWALPVILFMTALSFLYPLLAHYNISSDFIRFIPAMAIAFILVATYKISKKVIKDRTTLILAVLSTMIIYFIRDPWIYPLLLISGGVIACLIYKEKNMWNYQKVSFPWIYIIVLMGIALATFVLATVFDNLFYELIYHFYRFGYLVFGGGQVVVPLMFNQLVDISGVMTSEEFLTGYGLVQGLPGPMFSFSAYAGGMAGREFGIIGQTAMGFLSGILIFLPGNLLIYFVYPVWNDLRKMKGIKIALKGINAVASGMIFVASLILLQQVGIAIDNILVIVVSSIILLWGKIPAPLLVLAVLGLGFII